MKNYRLKRIISLSILLGITHVSWAACNQTLSPGANLANAVSGAAAGSTICLNAGSYGNVTLQGINKTGDVIVQSASGNTASLTLSIANSNHIKVQNMTLYGAEIGGSTNITIANNLLTGDSQSHSSWQGTGQIVYRSGGNSNANNKIDGNKFTNISVCTNCYEGWISAQPGGVASGLTISNNTFTGPGNGDFIQTGTSGVIVGPGNSFTGLSQAYCDSHSGRHCDAIQGYGQDHTTITGNYFAGNDVQIMMPDGGNTEVITNNVFIANSGNNGIQLGTHMNDSFIHNTVKNITVNMDKKMENTTSSQNIVARNNIMINSNFKTVDSGGNAACSNCTFDHNVFNSSTYAKGTDNLIGTPTFIGGTSPTTWPGYQLTSSSLGYSAGTDGKDMGTNFYGAGVTPTVPLLASPTNLRTY
jgi:hypothetical protein